MKNVYEVLRQKEAEIERLTKELQALHIVAPLLLEDIFKEQAQVAAPAVQRNESVPQSALVTGAPNSKPAWP